MSEFKLWRRETTVADIQRYWGKQADKWVKHDPLGVDVVQAISSFVPRTVDPINLQGPVLDLFSGADPTAYLSTTDPQRIHAIDISEQMLERNPAGQKIVADIRQSIPVPEDAFSLVTMFFGWSHLYYGPYSIGGRWLESGAESLYLKVLRDIRKKLRAGGQLLIVDVGYGYMEDTGCREFRPSGGYSNIGRLAQDVGFADITSGKVFYKESPGFDWTNVTEILFLQARKPAV